MRELEATLEQQRQALLARDESIKRLLHLLQAKGPSPPPLPLPPTLPMRGANWAGGVSESAVADRVELESERGRAAELEARCRFLEDSMAGKEADVRALQEECLQVSALPLPHGQEDTRRA